MEKRMKTLVVDREGRLSVEECRVPEYNAWQALVKTISCGICNGTDGKLIHRNFKGMPVENYPIMLGHEAVGRVVEVGSKVTSFKVGDIVMMPFCDKIGEFDTGWGGYSEYGVVYDAQACKSEGFLLNSEAFPDKAYAQTVVPEEFDPVKAAMIVTFREVLSAIKVFGIKENQSAVVYGCGPVGLTFVKFLRILGASPIIAIDKHVEDKVQTAVALGADYGLDAKDRDNVKKIRELCPGGVDYVIDAVGATDVINEAMLLIKDRGSICCYGISANTKAEIDWTKAPYNWNLRFQQMPDKVEEYLANHQVVAWLKDGIISFDDYISDIIDFKDILSAFEKIEAKQLKKKCIIRYE